MAKNSCKLYAAIDLKSVFLVRAIVILRLKDSWPGLLIINGRARHPQSQGLVERSNAVVQKMLGKWLEVNNTRDWPSGLGNTCRIDQRIFLNYTLFLF